MEINLERPRIVIGIDPDVDGSGVGVIDLEKKTAEKQMLPLPQLVEFLRGKDGIKVYIEAGWMNHGNYHLKNKGQYHASKIGEQVGRNHEVSRIIGEFCEFHNIPFQFIKPLQKRWKGKDGKITHEELMAIVEGSGLKTEIRRTNQETRDALLIALSYSNIPLRVNRTK